MLIKLIGIICVIGTSIAIGTYFIQRDKDRLYLVKELRKMILLWIGCVRQSNESIPELLRNISIKLDKRIGVILCNVVDKMQKMDGEDIKVVWKNEVIKEKDNTSLKDEDIEILVKIGDIIGFLDKKLQIENMDNYIYELDESIHRISQEILEKHRIYRTLSVMVGIFIVLVFI